MCNNPAGCNSLLKPTNINSFYVFFFNTRQHNTIFKTVHLITASAKCTKPKYEDYEDLSGSSEIKWMTKL
jgi:hypothetical protein